MPEEVFYKELISKFIATAEKQVEEMQKLRLSSEKLFDEMRRKPCFEHEFEEEKEKCKSCTIEKLEEQLKTKDNLISFMIKTLALLATATVAAAGWVTLK